MADGLFLSSKAATADAVSVVRLDAATGETVWTSAAGTGSSWVSGVVGDVVLVTNRTADGTKASPRSRPADGGESWSTPFTGDVVISGGHAFVRTSTTVAAVDPDAGVQPAVTGDVVVVAGRAGDGRLGVDATVYLFADLERTAEDGAEPPASFPLPRGTERVAYDGTTTGRGRGVRGASPRQRGSPAVRVDARRRISDGGVLPGVVALGDGALLVAVDPASADVSLFRPEPGSVEALWSAPPAAILQAGTRGFVVGAGGDRRVRGPGER